MKRPEHILPAEIFYNELEAKKYTSNTRMIQAQYELTERAIEILRIPEEKIALILDIGCGSGLSGEVLSEHGHLWVGLDISKAMLSIARENEAKGDVMECDIGQGFSFRPGTFDYAISISAIQWLCNAEKSCHDPIKRLKSFFESVYKCLVIGGRCCFQFYPDNPEQVDLISNAALKVGFTGGVVIDFPNSTKAKKYYLFLQAGFTKESIEEVKNAVKAKDDDDELEDEDDEENEQISYFKKKNSIKNKKKTTILTYHVKRK